MYMYGIAHDFGAIVPKKRADMVGVYYIYMYMYSVAHNFGAIVPKKWADIVGVYHTPASS